MYVYICFLDSIINPLDFNSSFAVTKDNFADDLNGVTRYYNFGVIVMLDLFHPKEERKPFRFLVCFLSKNLGISQYFVSSRIEDDSTRTCLPWVSFRGAIKEESGSILALPPMEEVI